MADVQVYVLGRVKAPPVVIEAVKYFIKEFGEWSLSLTQNESTEVYSLRELTFDKVRSIGTNGVAVTQDHSGMITARYEMDSWKITLLPDYKILGFESLCVVHIPSIKEAFSQ